MNKTNILSPIQLEEVKRVKKYLVDYLNKNLEKYYTTYSELVCECALPYFPLNNPQNRIELGKVLAYLLEEELKYGRPLITSVIYGKKLYRPRDGFYNTLIRINYKGTANKKARDLYKEKKERRKIETEAVEYWRNPKNIKKYKNSLLSA